MDVERMLASSLLAQYTATAEPAVDNRRKAFMAVGGTAAAQLIDAAGAVACEFPALRTRPTPVVSILIITSPLSVSCWNWMMLPLLSVLQAIRKRRDVSEVLLLAYPA